MLSTASPGKFNDAVDCDLVFYKQQHHIFHIIDRCIRYATGMEIPDKTMTTILDAYHQCWMQSGPAKVLYSVGEGTLKNDTAKAVLKAKALNSEFGRVNSALRRSRPEMASYVIYFTSWRLNSIG
eukprot:7898854-Pyramimonas_sp.AAC.1